MKKHEYAALGLVILAVLAGVYSDQTNKRKAAAGQEVCDQSLWSHVYKSDRLEIIDDCTTVSGVITFKKMENDGDYHIQLRVDDQYAWMLNDKNKSLLDGNLVLEPVCENPVLDEDAKDACSGFYGSIGVPPVGTHVVVTGSYVLDATHGWNEIHPVSGILTK